MARRPAGAASSSAAANQADALAIGIAHGDQTPATLNRTMLSLAKLKGGTGAAHWLAQAQGRVTHAQSVSSGVEDYYLAGPEAVGQWAGGGVARLELDGDVSAVPLRCLTIALREICSSARTRDSLLERTRGSALCGVGAKG
jgi:hypothetical protein